KKKTVCRFRDYFAPANIKTDFSVENKYEAIATMCKFAKDVKVVRDNSWLYEVVVAREDLVSTAYGNGVALLHPRHINHSKIKKPTILFGRADKGVDFDADDRQLVNLYFLLLLKDDKQHLFSLSYISRFLKVKENLDFLNKEKDANKIVEVLTKNFYK
ncbi:MAG: PTS sugar transporter subunit IIA, partial [Candidatus Cloacimonadota bacterium]|nr:PTS sugar transporter subunit IIA [Candidatus Cloacimonadota bacterium]